MPGQYLRELVLSAQPQCGRKLSISCKVELCVCKPDCQGKTIPSCFGSGCGALPDCYYFDPRDNNFYILECKCNIESRSRDLRDRVKFKNEVGKKFMNFNLSGIRQLAIPDISQEASSSFVNSLIEEFRRIGVKVIYCGQEPCNLCRVCS